MGGCIDDMTDEQRDEIRAQMQAHKEAWMALSDEERAALMDEKENAKAANAATVLGCSCCLDGGTDNVADLVEGREGWVAMSLGFRKPRGGGGHMGGGGQRPIFGG